MEKKKEIHKHNLKWFNRLTEYKKNNNKKDIQIRFSIYLKLNERYFNY